MKRFIEAACAALFLLTWISPVAAQDAFGVCEASDAQCDALAVEVRKVQLAAEEGLAVPQVNPSFLCTIDDPNCCPAHLMPVCNAQAEFIVQQTLIAAAAAPAADNSCPWSKSICDRLGGLYCGPDAAWNPWSGCQVAVDPGADLPDNPTCPVGQYEPTPGKGCVPIKCFDERFGVEILCGPEGNEVFVVEADRFDEGFLRRIGSDAVTQAAQTALEK